MNAEYPNFHSNRGPFVQAEITLPTIEIFGFEDRQKQVFSPSRAVDPLPMPRNFMHENPEPSGNSMNEANPGYNYKRPLNSWQVCSCIEMND